MQLEKEYFHAMRTADWRTLFRAQQRDGLGGRKMQELIQLIKDATPFALKFMAAGGIVIWVVLSIMRKRPAPILLTFATALYLGYLLHGTCVNRIKSWEHLLTWNLPDFDSVWWNFELGARTRMTAVHAVFNVALFVPWGALGTCYQRKMGAGFLVLLSGMLMSVCIEFFQVTHGMAFDLGDVLTNSIGTAAGCVLGLPVLLINGWIYKRKRRRGKNPDRKK